MSPLEYYGIDNPDFVTARMEEKAKEEERIKKGKKQIIENIKHSQKHYHGLYLMTTDWLKNYVKTGKENFGEDNYKEDLERIGEVDGKKIVLTEEIAEEILKEIKK